MSSVECPGMRRAENFVVLDADMNSVRLMLMGVVSAGIVQECRRFRGKQSSLAVISQGNAPGASGCLSHCQVLAEKDQAV